MGLITLLTHPLPFTRSHSLTHYSLTHTLTHLFNPICLASILSIHRLIYVVASQDQIFTQDCLVCFWESVHCSQAIL